MVKIKPSDSDYDKRENLVFFYKSNKFRVLLARSDRLLKII